MLARGEPWLVAAAAAAFLYLLFFREGVFVYGRDQFAGTYIFDQPARVARGEVMYRDFFEFLGPGLAHLHAAAILAFGQRIAPLGSLFILVGVALTCTVHRLASAAIASWMRLMPPAAFGTLVYARNEMGDHKWPAVLCGVMGLAVLARASSRPRSLGGGALLGAGMLFNHDFAAGIAAGSLAWIVAAREERPRLPLVLAGAVLAAALPMAYFVARAGLRTVLFDTVVFVLTRYHTITRYYFSVHPVDLPGWARLVLGLGGPLAAAAVLLAPRALFPDLEPRRRRVLQATAFGGLGLIAGTAHRGLDVMGPAWIGILVVPLFAVLDRIRARGGALRVAALGVAGLAAAGAAWNAVALVARVHAASGWTRQRHRGGDVWLARPWPALVQLEAHTAPGDPVFFIPAFGAYEFLSHTRNATSFPALLDHHTPEQVRQALDEIEARRPGVGLFDPGPIGPVSRPHVFFPPIEAFLRERYDFERLPGGVYLLRLKASRAHQR